MRRLRRYVPGVAFVAALLGLAAAGCGDDFSLCTDLDPGPPDCEICSNGRDDDLDGDTDCDDRDCDSAAACDDSDLVLSTRIPLPRS